MQEKTPIIILGGGIHGVGVLHDLCSRGFTNVRLYEKGTLGSGTSSKSTKLIHGGLRYLERPSQIPLVYECLHERSLLLKLAPDLVHPIELMLPVPKKNLQELIRIKIGLSLYDFLAGSSGIASHRVLNLEEACEKVPLLKNMKEHRVYSYWDAQTDDQALVRRVAHSAEKLGGLALEEHEVIHLWDRGNFWELAVKDKSGRETLVKAAYVINCLGPWANDFLERNSFHPTHKGENNKGTHLLFKDFSLKAGLLLKALDRRVFFVLPWKGKTLVGTTEELFEGDQDKVFASEEEIQYLLDSFERALGVRLKRNDMEKHFSGLRWLAVEKGKSLTRTSRESVWGTHENQNGFLLTLYGGKLTSYRKLCEKIGGLVSKSAHVSTPTRTHLKESWWTLS